MSDTKRFKKLEDQVSDLQRIVNTMSEGNKFYFDNLYKKMNDIESKINSLIDQGDTLLSSDPIDH